jgi:hypothetical protein
MRAYAPLAPRAAILCVVTTVLQTNEESEMKHLLLCAAAALLMALSASVRAQTIVNVQPYNNYVCTITYSNGVTTLGYCPTDWPPAGPTLNVACNCEHLGSPFDDLCEVTYWPFALGSTYSYQGIGKARMPVQPSPYSEFVQFACPYGTPPGSTTCTVVTTVTSPWGATGSSVCRSH